MTRRRGDQAPSALQPLADLEAWWQEQDPWDYETTPADHTRRAMLLAAIPRRTFRRVLDIGSGNGFVTEKLPGEEVVGVDVSENAIRHALEHKGPRTNYFRNSLFDLPSLGWDHAFDLIVVTGVLYPQYIARCERLVYTIVDSLLEPGGILVSCHIDEWYACRFPYLTLSREYYPYREYTHVLEVYLK